VAVCTVALSWFFAKVGLTFLALYFVFVGGSIPGHSSMPANAMNIASTSVKISPFVCNGISGSSAVIGEVESCLWDHHIVAYNGHAVAYQHDRWGSFVYDLVTGATTQVRPDALPKPSSETPTSTIIRAIQKESRGCGFDCAYSYMIVRQGDGKEIPLFVNPPERHKPIDGIGEFSFKDGDIVYTKADGMYFWSFDSDRLAAVRRATTGELRILPDVARAYWKSTRVPPYDLETVCGGPLPRGGWAPPERNFEVECQAISRAVAQRDPTICNEAAYLLFHDCLMQIARVTRDRGVCERMASPYLREACKLLVAEGG